MDVLENAKGHFQTLLENDLQSIEVPEWGDGDKPAVIYFRPSMTMKQQAAILAVQNAADRVVETLVQRALDADGRRIFKPANRVELMKMVDSDVINRVVIQMNAAEPPEDAAGKH